MDLNWEDAPEGGIHFINTAMNMFAAYDKRANFPLYRLNYIYDGLYPSIIVDHRQENRYIGASIQESNRFTTTELLFSYPIDDFRIEFGGTVLNSRFQGVRKSDGGLQTRLSHYFLLNTPDSIVPETGERGWSSEAVVSTFFTGGNRFVQVEQETEIRIPLFKRHFLRLNVASGKSYNPDFPPIPFVGGGQVVLSAYEPYLLRGYEVGSLFGRSIHTLQLEYWFPLLDIFSGYGSWPFSTDRLKAQLFVDTGTAEFVGAEESGSRHWPVGVGANLLLDLKLLFHFPWTAAVGFHWGLEEEHLGEKQFLVGLYYNGDT